MPISDALIVGEDWISEHYFTTDATKESFQGRVVERRKEWDASEAPSPRSRFTAARADLERRFVEVAGEDGAPDPDAVRALYAELLTILGYRTGQLALREEGPLTFVSVPGLESAAPLVVLAGRPAATVDDVVAKHVSSLLVPWEREGEDPVVSVSGALSTLVTDADGPAFALVLAGRWALVAERERWPEGRWLAVDLQLVAERNETKRGGEIDRALTCLDARSLAPDAAGTTWWREALDESVKHTVGVSRDLQEGVRTSIEIIANEVVSRRRARGLDPLPQAQAQPLAVQSLRYLYRILFLLYAEASPELGVLPVGAAEYDAGYGLDRLRDLVLDDIHTQRAREGTHLYESLATLFRLVDGGHHPAGDDDLPDGLEFRELKADLFAPSATSLIDEVGLGNAALLRVLRLLLLSKEKKGRERGFISYVELGINQLGAVYEGLMSYTGSFAVEEMYEVARDGNPEKGSWVVPTHRADDLAAHIVRRENPDTGEKEPVVYRAGEFVFRLSGRDRQRSASYYTPEVLTRFTVQQALEELLDQDGCTTTAEEILHLSVCEPALGSGAFAIEAVRQLAEEYITRREAELGERIDPDQRPVEVQKVKAHIALHQVYGVDLNATAVELAEVSLWLDTMVAGLQAPWFGLRLRRGNSLVGARRALYGTDTIKDRSWLTATPTDEPMTSLAAGIDGDDPFSLAGRVHHFLLPAQGWGSAVEVPKVVRDLVPANHLKELKAWRSSMRKKPTPAQLRRLQALAGRVEALWAIALRRLRIAEAESGRTLDLWGRPAVASDGAVTRDLIEALLAAEDGAYRRLRLVMDLWCALWFWPLTEFHVKPPTLDEWIDACEAILGVVDTRAKNAWMDTLGSGSSWDELNRDEKVELAFAGAQSRARVRDQHPWVAVGESVADAQAFFHWELDFAAVFARGGFDLQVGNPPWVRPTVDVESLLAEGDPWWALAHKPSEAAKNARRPETLQIGRTWRTVVDGTAETVATAEYVGDTTNHPYLTGQPDLYRVFMSQVWAHAAPTGMSALIHLESHFTDDKAQPLRRETYRRLRRHWQFINELRLFEIEHHKTYGVNVYGASREPLFVHATSLYHPDTVTRSFAHDGSGDEPGFKDPEGHWDTRPHAARMQTVDEDGLRVWADVLGDDSWPSTPMVYTVNTAAARTLQHLAAAPRMESLGPQFSSGWHERADRERGRFEASWGPTDWTDAILQGPHVHVSTPLYKTPNHTMRNQNDWSATDFEALGVDARPITAYKPMGDRAAYDAAYTHWTTTDENGSERRMPARDYYRVAWRCMAPNTGERTFVPGVIPPRAAHVDGVFSAALPLAPLSDLLAVTGVMSAITSDFAVRAAPKSTIRGATIVRLPTPPLDHRLLPALALRTLRLNSVTEAYADLWSECWNEAFPEDSAILPRFDERPIGPKWTADTPLRRAADRRNAQVEIDALVALMLGIPVDDLCTIYRTQFAVLYGYDHHDYTFDANGRLVPNSVLALWRKRGKPADPTAMSAADRTATHPGSGIDYTYELPFTLLDREEDFRTAYAEFERRLAATEQPESPA